jgi:hypothetical protein
MGFKAAQIEKLNYDFRPYKDVSGTIPEPSSAQVEKFREAMGDVMKHAASIDPDTWGGGKDADGNPKELTTEVMVARIDLTLSKSAEVEKETTNAVIELTGLDSELIWSLPYRTRAAFAGWIVGEFFNPEG